MSTFKITYKELMKLVLESNLEVEKCIAEIKTHNSHFDDALIEKIKRYLSKTFVPHFKTRWQQVNRKKSDFCKKYSSWLDNTCTITSSEELTEVEPCSSSVVGRPEKPFEECAERTQRRKVKELLDTVSEELLMAASRKLSRPTFAFSCERALAILIDASLSKHDYIMIRQSTKEEGNDIFPPYDQLLIQKKLCYPAGMEVSESFATVKLQSLLDHTVQRIFLTKSERELDSLGDQFTFLSKWGCDGSSGHSEYKQSFEDDDTTDANMFLTSFVPLRLTDLGLNVHIWQNPRPSSPRFCRPIRFTFTKETPEVIRQEVDRIKTEILNLENTVINLNGKVITVTHRLILSMIDGKVAQALTDTASMAVCSICKAKPTEMNNIDLLETKPIYEEAIHLGLSPLHARIKFMECILHIAYNLSFQKWKSTKDTKESKENTKKIIQEKFKQMLGLNIDQVKQGMGTTNDGNTSRRFFKDPAITAEITGVNENLIHRFRIILDTLNSGAEIDPEKFENYCRDTAKLYLDLYNWYYMPNTVHKILLHGGTIISASMIPIGLLTEEAQEARNKDYRSYRREHSRKSSRLYTNEDVFNFLMASSDPYINTFRAEPKTRIKNQLHSDSLNLVR